MFIYAYICHYFIYITFRSNKVLTVFYIFFVYYINSPSYKLKIIIAQALINKNMMNDREIYTAIGRDCGIRILKIQEIIILSFVSLSGFIRDPGNPKVEHSVILLSRAFGTKNITDKIKKTRV